MSKNEYLETSSGGDYTPPPVALQPVYDVLQSGSLAVVLCFALAFRYIEPYLKQLTEALIKSQTQISVALPKIEAILEILISNQTRIDERLNTLSDIRKYFCLEVDKNNNNKTEQ